MRSDVWYYLSGAAELRAATQNTFEELYTQMNNTRIMQEIDQVCLLQVHRDSRISAAHSLTIPSSTRLVLPTAKSFTTSCMLWL